MKTSKLFIFFISFFSFSLVAQNELPIRQTSEKLKPLFSLSNASLQTSLEKELNMNSKWKSLIKKNKMALGLVDLSNPNLTKYASINGDHMMYAASLPKISILLAAMDAIESGELIETPEVSNDMKIMISKSNNQAATRMIDRVGYDKIESVMTSDKYALYDEDEGGGLWVGKRYGGGGDTNREPLLNLSHAATADQVCRFYYLLAHGKLVNSDRSKQMLDIMEDPALHHKFVNTLDQIAPNARLFRKSGSWKNFHSDSILVWGKDPKRRYILVALIEDESGEQIIRNLIKPIEKALKKAIQKS